MNKNYICLQKCNRVSKNAEFYAYFKSIGKSAKNACEKSVNQKRGRKSIFFNGFVLGIKFCIFKNPNQICKKVCFEELKNGTEMKIYRGGG
jgi:hypothetical protein